MAASKDIAIAQGKTFTLVLRWEASPIIRLPITGITCPNGAAIVGVDTTLIPNGWRVAITNVKGMTDINAADPNKLRDSDYTPATVLSPTSLELNEVNAAGYKPWTSGGFVNLNTPVDITGFTARMDIKDKVGGTVLLALTTDVAGGIVVDPTAHTIVITISATDTAALLWTKGVYELELVSNGTPAVVTSLLMGKVTVSKEVTT
jgi:hypothetical protein